MIALVGAVGRCRRAPRAAPPPPRARAVELEQARRPEAYASGSQRTRAPADEVRPHKWRAANPWPSGWRRKLRSRSRVDVSAQCRSSNTSGTDLAARAVSSAAPSRTSAAQAAVTPRPPGFPAVARPDERLVGRSAPPDRSSAGGPRTRRGAAAARTRAWSCRCPLLRRPGRRTARRAASSARSSSPSSRTRPMKASPARACIPASIAPITRAGKALVRTWLPEDTQAGGGR